MQRTWFFALWASLVVSCSASFGGTPKVEERWARKRAAEAQAEPETIFKRQGGPRFLSNKTASFAVQGDAIPDVDFDVGESYSGRLPISNKTDEAARLFWWFFPTTSTEESAQKEILIWLNGGPGCSSLEGFIQENGPFMWQYGTFKPVANPWSWHHLLNMVWVEQPVGTGFSRGPVTARNEDDVAVQFLGFWRNFVDLFDLHDYKVYIAGESYAGYFCPYIAHHMLEANDTSYYDLTGVLIYDPVLTHDEVHENIPVVPFVDYWRGLHPFNDSFTAYIHNVSDSCGYTDFMNTYLTYPPPGPQPNKLPGTDAAGRPRPQCSNLFYDILDASLAINPCYNIYQVTTTCPLLWDVLGFPGTSPYTPPGAQIYFNRTDVKTAIHAPQDVDWTLCGGRVFAGSDSSLPSGLSVLPGVIDRTQNVMIGHGATDFILIANGTLLAIQNMTWGGKLGFQQRPDGPFFVPYHRDGPIGTIAGSGVFGTAHTERGLTYVGVDLSGHMVPQYAPSAAFRQVEVLLGRVPSLASVQPFTIGQSVPQPHPATLGLGTAPQGWAEKGLAVPVCPRSEAESDTTRRT